jgi:DNA excision repair protein ERCC-4
MDAVVNNEIPSSVIPPAPDTTAPECRVLPVLRGLSGLADGKPVIVIDSREQAPLQFARFQSVRGTLYSGDYSICGLEEHFAIERKSICDLVSCCMGGQRDRFEHELHRLRGYRFKRLLIIGSREEIMAGRFRSRISPKAVLATLGAFEVRYDLPVIFAASPREAADLVERWAWWYSREVVEIANNLLRRCARQNAN